jgi:hypothetical protein
MTYWVTGRTAGQPILLSALRDRIQAVIYAYEHGLIVPGDR